MLTQEQVKANIDAMTSQGAQPGEIQGWLDSLKGSNPSANIQTDAQKTQAGRNYISEAGNMYNKYFQEPMTNSLDWTSNFVREAFPATASYKRLGGELAIMFDKNLSKQQADLQSNTDAISKNIYDKYINNPDASIEQRKKGIALLQTLTVPDLYSASSGFDRNDTASTINKYLGDIGSDAFDVAIWGMTGGLGEMAPTTGFLQKAGQVTGNAIKTGLKFGAAQTGKTAMEGISQNKPLEQISGEALKAGAGMAGVVAGIEAAIPIAAPFFRLFPFIAKKLESKMPVVDLMTQLENKTNEIKAGISTSQKAGEQIIDSAYFRNQVAQKQVKETVDAVTNMAADSVAPKVEGNIANRIETSIQRGIVEQKNYVNKVFYETPEAVSISVVPEPYYAKLTEIANKFKNVEGWESMYRKATSWLKKNTEETGLSADVIDSYGPEVLASLKKGGQIPETEMAAKSVKDLIYTKEAVDGMIRFNAVQGMSTFDRPLNEISQSLKKSIEQAIKGTPLEGKYQTVLDLISNRKENLGILDSFMKSENKTEAIFGMTEKEVKAVREMTDPDSYINLQEDVKRKAIESAKDKVTGYVKPDELNKNIKILNSNKMLGPEDLAELSEYEEFVRYFQNGAEGPTPASLKKLNELATGKKPDVVAQTTEVARAEQVLGAVGPKGEGLQQLKVQADTVIDKMLGVQSPTLMDEVLKTVPQEVRDTIPQRIYLNAFSDAFAVTKEGTSKFNPEKVKSYLESIGYGKGGKEEIVKKLIPNEAQRKLLGEFYDAASKAEIGSKPLSKKIAHMVLAFGYTQTGSKTAAVNHLMLADLFKKSKKGEVEKFINDFSTAFGASPIKMTPEEVQTMQYGAMTALIESTLIKGAVATEKTLTEEK